MRLLPDEPYKIIDNVLSIDDFNFIKQQVSGSEFPWYYQPSVAEYNQEQLPEFYFTHTLLNGDTNQPSFYFKFMAPLIEKLEIKSLIRVKANLYPNFGREIINQPHVDFSFDHVGAVFYINTNNGYTILEDGTKIESRENRLLLFNAGSPHQSTHCTDQKVRLNINFNYFQKEKLDA